LEDLEAVQLQECLESGHSFTVGCAMIHIVAAAGAEDPLRSSTVTISTRALLRLDTSARSGSESEEAIPLELLDLGHATYLARYSARG